MATDAVRVAVADVNTEAFRYYPRLARVLQFVGDNLSSPITLALTAQVANLESKYFSRYFRQRVGVPFRQWLSLLRVHRATEIIRLSDESLTRVAYAAGFQDARTFERAFKRVTATTPRDFKTCFAPGVARRQNGRQDELRRRLVTLCRSLEEIRRATIPARLLT